jgi:hypothetical protein
MFDLYDDSVANFNARQASRTSSTAEQSMTSALLIGIAFVLTSLAAWVTHVIVCIKASAWVLLAFGCIVAPVGVIHGIGVWFGVF